MKVKVGISNRHIHLKKEDLEILFGKNYKLTKRNDLSQINEFASNETVSVKSEKNEIKNVRVLGPTRNYSQVEISKTDSYVLKIKPPIRESGQIKGAPTVLVLGPRGKVLIPVIIANRHIHINTNEINNYNLKDGDEVKIKIEGEKGGILENVKVKSKDTYVYELHLDTDDANAFLLKNGDEVEIIKEYNDGRN